MGTYIALRELACMHTERELRAQNHNPKEGNLCISKRSIIDTYPYRSVCFPCISVFSMCKSRSRRCLWMGHYRLCKAPKAQLMISLFFSLPVFYDCIVCCPPLPVFNVTDQVGEICHFSASLPLLPVGIVLFTP